MSKICCELWERLERNVAPRRSSLLEECKHRPDVRANINAVRVSPQQKGQQMSQLSQILVLPADQVGLPHLVDRINERPESSPPGL